MPLLCRGGGGGARRAAHRSTSPPRAARGRSPVALACVCHSAPWSGPLGPSAAAPAVSSASRRVSAPGSRRACSQRREAGVTGRSGGGRQSIGVAAPTPGVLAEERRARRRQGAMGETCVHQRPPPRPPGPSGTSQAAAWAVPRSEATRPPAPGDAQPAVIGPRVPQGPRGRCDRQAAHGRRYLQILKLISDQPVRGTTGTFCGKMSITLGGGGAGPGLRRVSTPTSPGRPVPESRGPEDGGNPGPEPQLRSGLCHPPPLSCPAPSETKAAKGFSFKNNLKCSHVSVARTLSNNGSDMEFGTLFKSVQRTLKLGGC